MRHKLRLLTSFSCNCNPFILSSKIRCSCWISLTLPFKSSFSLSNSWEQKNLIQSEDVIRHCRDLLLYRVIQILFPVFLLATCQGQKTGLLPEATSEQRKTGPPHLPGRKRPVATFSLLADSSPSPTPRKY